MNSLNLLILSSAPLKNDEKKNPQLCSRNHFGGVKQGLQTRDEMAGKR